MEWINQLWSRLQGYPSWQVVIELAVIGAIVFVVWRFVQGTRAAGALRALILLLVVGTVLVRLASQRDVFPRLSQLYTRILGFSAIALVVIFQPELRRALIRIGELPAVRPFFRPTHSAGEQSQVVDSIVAASRFLSKNKFGAIVAVERQVGLREMLVGSTVLNADISPELLESIFWPNNPLHDLGVVVRGNKVLAAGVQFPLADPEDMNDPSLGARHRAAVGLTRVSDAIVVVVSEETGAISIAERGRLDRWRSPESLATELLRRLRTAPPEAEVEEGLSSGTDDEPATRLALDAADEPERRRTGGAA
ncbi:MAG: TIGR00159 family protein [Phycisphaerales bacterium]|nr:TIGR00159 family protein [Phycisphaerales bacterium]